MATLSGIDLAQYRAQAKELLQLVRATNPEAVARVRRQHPEGESALPRSDSQPRFCLADAQLVLAREQGFPSWAKFKDYLLFSRAVQALDAGDIPRLEALFQSHPSLIRYRCRTGKRYEAGYFAGATLLNHVAGNPIRCPLPANILDVTALLLRYGAGKDRERAHYTIHLILTSHQASAAHVALPLVDLIAAASGIEVDLSTQKLAQPIGNHAPDTAREMIRRGARMDIRHAAALGEMGVLRRLIARSADVLGDPRLIPLPPSPEEAQLLLDKAFIWACFYGHAAAAELLLRSGADPTSAADGGQPGAHLAAHGGHLETIQGLIRFGIPLEVTNEYGGTVLGQAVWSAINEPRPDHPDIIRALIAAGAKFDPDTSFGRQVAPFLA